MRAVLDFLTSCVELIKMWLRQRYGERRAADREADRAAVCDDAGGEWFYTYRGETFTEPGEWVHLPAGEAGNLLLWIRGVEEAQ